MLGPEIRGGQEADGPYRYLLWRRWADGAASALYVMLNPSTADATVDDPTVLRCRMLATRWGFGAIEVVNLFALRATDPRDLVRAAADPPAAIGPGNDAAIRAAAARADVIIAAWGNHGALAGRADHVLALLGGRPLRCLEVNAGGAPRHPLYVPLDARPRPWPAR